MTVPDLPFVGQTHWGQTLNTGIDARYQSAQTQIDGLKDLTTTGRLSEASLTSSIATSVAEQVPPAVAAAIADDDTIRDTAAQAAQDVVDGLSLVVVSRHGADPNEARPDGDVVWWIGSVEPLNAEPHDVWDDSEND